MTIVRIGKMDHNSCLEFEFDYDLSAFTFYSMVKDSYREDDLCICMVEETKETDNEESLHFGEDEWADKDSLWRTICKSGEVPEE